MKKQRCKKCNAVKGQPHTSGCIAARFPMAYPEHTLYTTVADTGSSWGGSCSSTHDSGSSSSSSSDSGGGGGCE